MKICHLFVKDSPTFKELSLNFSSGLNVVSGPSGSGKSVFFTSLLSLFGINECNASVIEGNLEGEMDLGEYLEEDEIEIQILRKDKTRYFINHQSIAKKRLSELFAPVVKSLSHKNSNELSSDFLLKMLDLMIADKNHLQNLEEYQKSFLEIEMMQKELQKIKDEEKNLIQLREFALFEIEKIAAIDPKEGEYEDLLETKKMLSKREKLQSLGIEAMNALEQVGKIGAFLEMLDCKIDGYQEMMLEVESRVQTELDKLDEIADVNPEDILNRLSQCSSLISRYGGIKEALDYKKLQEEKLQSYERIEDSHKELEQKIQFAQNHLQSLAQAISAMRMHFVPQLQAKIEDFASLLLLNGVRLEIKQISMQQNGNDSLEIKLKDSDVATLSSGEYNRLRLAVLAVEKRQNAGILFLDEIDANLSGEESEGVAKVLKSLSSSYQVFAISHQPHLPSLADSHFVVKKEKEGSAIYELESEGRILEIARMISGSNLTQEALEFARKKIQEK